MNQSFARSSWIPRKICYPSTMTLYRRVPLSLRSIYDNLCSTGWKFYVTESRYGYCYGEHKVITIPLISLGQSSDLVSWLIAHEMTHALVGVEHQHNEVFMAKLIEICPAHLLRFEAEYKPANFSRAIKLKEKSKPIHLSLVPTTRELLS